MSRWFRFYADARHNEKVASLSDWQFRLWTELLSVASENDGHIPCPEKLSRMIKRRVDHLLRGLDGLITVGLIDALDGHYTPHNWNKFQYKSDTSTPRATLHRARRATAPETETETDNTIAKAMGADAPQNVVQIDPLKALFDQGVSILTASGVGEKPARGLIGKWRRDYGDGKLLEALTDCKARSPTNALEWIVKALASRGLDDPYSIENTRPVL
jgi:hypothetical protein